MAPKLEAIRGGGGSVKVGTVGTIGSLMTREIESTTSKSSLRTPALRDCNTITSTSRTPEVLRKKTSQNHGTKTPKQTKQKTPFEDVGNKSNVSRGSSSRTPDLSGKTRTYKYSYRVPMLGSENIQLEKTPIRDKPCKKGVNLVDIVDINCGNPRGSLSNRLKRLNFSRLSQSFM